MWLWENQFGRCIGGSHPLLPGKTVRSSTLFTVLHALVESSTVENHQRVRLCEEKERRVEANKSMLPAEMQGEQVVTAMVGGV